MRNRRFAAALQVITQPRSAALVSALSPPGVADFRANSNPYGGSAASLPAGSGSVASTAGPSLVEASAAQSRGNGSADAQESVGPSAGDNVSAAMESNRSDLATDEAVATEESESASGQKRPLSAMCNVSSGDYSASRYASMNDGFDDDDDDDDLDDPDQPPLAKRRASPSVSAASSSSVLAAVASMQPPPPPYYIQAHQQLRNLPDKVMPRTAMQPIRPQQPQQQAQQPPVADAQGFIPPSAVRTPFAHSSPLPSPHIGGGFGPGFSSPAGPPVVWSIPALRMERIGSDRWLMKETRVFDVANFIDTVMRHQLTGPLAATAGGTTNPLTTGSILLIQETKLAAEMASPLMELERRSAHPFGSGSVLEQELQLRGALVTSWPLDEIAQFVSFLRAYQQHCRYISDRSQQVAAVALPPPSKSTPSAGTAVDDTANDDQQAPANEPMANGSTPRESDAAMNVVDNVAGATASSPNKVEPGAAAVDRDAASEVVLPSLWEYWQYQNGRRPLPSTGEAARSVGYLVYEAPVQVIVLLRAQPSLSIPDDLWCTMYPHDFTVLLAEKTVEKSASFGALLIDLFPQLSHVGRDGSGTSVANITVRYLAHPQQSSAATTAHNTSEGTGLPRKAPLAQYQTIGTWAHAAARLLVR